MNTTQLQQLQEDVLDMLVQAGTQGLTRTNLVAGLRNSMQNCFVTPRSGRVWRNVREDEMLALVEAWGCTVTYHARTTGNGSVCRITL